MKGYQVIVAINSFSITHTEAREAASRAGARVATMRGAIPEMFYPDGPISVDYLKVKKETKSDCPFSDTGEGGKDHHPFRHKPCVQPENPKGT